MNTQQFRDKANQLGRKNKAFFFLLDFELRKPFVCPLDEALHHGFYYNIRGKTNFRPAIKATNTRELSPVPMEKRIYARAFEQVMRHLQNGNTYLINLTFPTPLSHTLNMKEIFAESPAPYKLYYQNNFVLFSPESFIKIREGCIHSFPMKGTIDASIPNAEEKILQDEKEHWEHNTIVDLIRNDLSIVSEDVHVPRFRYIDRIKTSNKELLQVSSEIKGKLPENWQSGIGDIILKLLPAGSISGAPKAKTVEIIRESEGRERGYFTGIFGIYENKSLDSAVNIRFIEKTQTGFQFRSGGGITAKSHMEEEYREMIHKVYVPLARNHKSQ